MNEETTCGCGRPTRYMVAVGRYSCNKYSRCLSYEELRTTLADTNMKLLSLLSCILPDFDIYTCNKNMTESVEDAKKIIERNKAAYILYLNKGE